ncbi:MAG: DUF2520 domain-containing protein [Rikenellaceae bacterium]
MIRIVIIGSGNVAYSLSHAVANSELDLVQICARNREKGELIARECNCEFTSDFENIAPADLYIISVSDKSIENIAKKIKFKDCVVAHTAGSVPLEALSCVGANHGVIYPLQTFTFSLAMSFENTPMLIEGASTHALACIRLVCDKLSKRVIEADSKTRKTVHLSAVFACNFTNHMFVIGERLLKGQNLDFGLIKPLIEETTRKALSSDSPLTTQTGPAIRNDYQTKAVHCEMLTEQAELKTMYINLSNSIWETSKKI